MLKLVGALVVCASLVGCATPAQNAALGGAVIGGAVAASVYGPHYRPVHTPLCYNTSYRDQFGNLIRRTTCR